MKRVLNQSKLEHFTRRLLSSPLTFGWNGSRDSLDPTLPHSGHAALGENQGGVFGTSGIPLAVQLLHSSVEIPPDVLEDEARM